MKRKLIICGLLLVLTLQILPFRNIDLLANIHHSQQDRKELLFFPDEKENTDDHESESKETGEELSKIIKDELVNDQHFSSHLSESLKTKRILRQKIGEPKGFYPTLIIPPPNLNS